MNFVTEVDLYRYLREGFKNETERVDAFSEIMIRCFPEVNDFNLTLDYLSEHGFFTAPASTKYHGAYEGGLFDHSFEVMNALVGLTKANALRWAHDRSPFIVGMFHDLCKIDNYRHPVCGTSMDGQVFYDPNAWEYNTECLFKGHGEKSVMVLSTLLMPTEEEVACIRYHMGAFTDKEEWRDYTRAVKKYPNVLWTHHADMLASHVKGV